MAIEDGCVLARLLAGAPDPVAALARFEAVRKPRTTRLVQAANDNVHRFHNEILADPVRGPDFISTEFAGKQVSDRYDWVYEYDAVQGVL